MKKAHVQYVEEAHAASEQDHSRPTSELHLLLLRFSDHEFVRIVHNLTVKKFWRRSYASNDIFIIILDAVSEGHRFCPFGPAARVRTPIFSLSKRHLRRYWILRFFLMWEKKFLVFAVTLNLLFEAVSLFQRIPDLHERKESWECWM